MPCRWALPLLQRAPQTAFGPGPFFSPALQALQHQGFVAPGRAWRAPCPPHHHPGWAWGERRARAAPGPGPLSRALAALEASCPGLLLGFLSAKGRGRAGGRGRSCPRQPRPRKSATFPRGWLGGAVARRVDRPHAHPRRLSGSPALAPSPRPRRQPRQCARTRPSSYLARARVPHAQLPPPPLRPARNSLARVSRPRSSPRPFPSRPSREHLARGQGRAGPEGVFLFPRRGFGRGRWRWSPQRRWRSARRGWALR